MARNQGKMQACAQT